MATYKDTGVDLESAAAAFGKMGPYVQQTLTTGVVGKVGAFGGFYELPGGYNNPILVSSVDGVGTKLKVAFRANRHDSIGEDLVNHCVNDIAVCGAKPLYFLDYFATGMLDPGIFESVIAGIARGCKANGCALIGGETAEMPDFYAEGRVRLGGHGCRNRGKSRYIGWQSRSGRGCRLLASRRTGCIPMAIRLHASRALAPRVRTALATGRRGWKVNPLAKPC